MKLCALLSGDNQHQYHTKNDEFLDKIQQEMSRALVEKVISNCYH